MKLRAFYFIVAILGAVLPYYFFGTFFSENGFNLALFLQRLFANRVSSGFAIDLVISSMVFWPFLFRECRELGLRYAWIFVLFNLMVGLSFAFPLFLYVRQRKLDLGK